MYVVTVWKLFSHPKQENKIISQHLLKLKEKTWELQIIHISTTNLMMHSYFYPEREGAYKSSFIIEMKAYNSQFPIIIM